MTKPILFGLGVLLLISFALTHGTQTGSAGSAQKKNITPQAAVQQEDEATPIKQMSISQQELGRLYSSYKGIGRNLIELVRERGEDVTIVAEPPLQMTRSTNETTSSETALESLTRHADAVVLGSVIDKTSLLNEDGKFIFTEHQVTIEEVFKDNLSASIDPGSKITIIRGGGKIRVDGRTVTAIDAAIRPIRIGRRYLLFLKWNSTTSTYQSISPFEVIGSKISALDTQLPDFQDEREVTRVFNDVRKAVKGGNEK